MTRRDKSCGGYGVCRERGEDWSVIYGEESRFGMIKPRSKKKKEVGVVVNNYLNNQILHTSCRQN